MPLGIILPRYKPGARNMPAPQVFKVHEMTVTKFIKTPKLFQYLDLEVKEGSS